MGHGAPGSPDQCKVINCPMGEKSHTVEIYVRNTRRKAGHILKEDCMVLCFVMAGGRRVEVIINLGTYSHKDVLYLLSLNV